MNATATHSGRPAGSAPFVAALALALWAGTSRGESVAGIGATASAAEAAFRTHVLRGIDGGEVSPASLRGHVVVVNFWASWCAPCRRELPRLQSLQAELDAAGAKVIAISIDEDPASARRFLRAHAPALHAAHDGPEGLAKELDLQHLPLTLVLDREGRVVWTTSASDDSAIGSIAAAARHALENRAVTVNAPAGVAR